jgi:hypothetical protein
MSKGLAATKSAAYLMLMPVPPMFRAVPAIFLATLVATTVITLVSVGLALVRARAAASPSSAAPAPRTGPFLIASGSANGLLFALCLWLAAMAAVTVLWAGAALVSTKSTADSLVTLKSVDPAIARLIFQASGGAINGTESGFIVTVGEDKVGGGGSSSRGGGGGAGRQ